MGEWTNGWPIDVHVVPDVSFLVPTAELVILVAKPYGSGALHSRMLLVTRTLPRSKIIE